MRTRWKLAYYKGTTNMTFLKMKNTDPAIGAQLNSRTHLLNFIFWSFEPFRWRLPSLQKVLMRKINLFLNKMSISGKKHDSVTFLLIHIFYNSFLQKSMYPSTQSFYSKKNWRMFSAYHSHLSVRNEVEQGVTQQAARGEAQQNL
jgi:hypothetical protein